MSTDGGFPFIGFGSYLNITPEDSNMVTGRWSRQRGQGTCALYQLRRAFAGKDSGVPDEGSELVPGLFVTLSNAYAFYQDTRKILWNQVS